MFHRVLWIFSLLCSTLVGQPDPLLQWLDRQAQRQLNQREQAIAAIHSRAEAQSRQKLVRQKLLTLLGGLPSYQGPLNARTTGALETPTYIIEKVIFESLPGFYVTGNLYRPIAPGRYPAILIPAGHTQEGKPEMQHLAANLAMKGYVALTYDPIGQGEREQTYLPQLGRALSGGGGNEHLELGARSILIGESVARYFIFDGMRALDYLAGRPDVDPTRLAVTGCSGGGAITTYLGALDPRLKAAAPGCHINSFRTLFTGPTPDSEMSLPQFLANGLDLADFYELSAPLPWLLLATTEDYFTPAGARPVYEETKNFYHHFDASDRLRFFIGQGPHGTPRETREEIYRWMNRWLKNDSANATDLPAHLYTNHELQVTLSGNVDQEPHSRKLYQIILEEFHARRQHRSVPELITELQQRGVRANSPAAVKSSEAPNQLPAYRLEQLTFEVEPGLTIKANLYLPRASAAPKPAVLIVEEKRLPVPLYVQRSQSTAAVAEAMAAAGAVVLELAPRDAPHLVDGRPFLGNWLTNERADLVGRNLAALRASDLLAGLDLLAHRTDVDPARVYGYARGVKGLWLLMAADLDPRLKKLWLDRTPVTYASALENPIATFLFEALIPGFALHWDVPDLIAALGNRPLLLTDPTNWMNQPVFPGAGYRYRHVGESDGALVSEFLK